MIHLHFSCAPWWPAEWGVQRACGLTVDPCEVGPWPYSVKMYAVWVGWGTLLHCWGSLGYEKKVGCSVWIVLFLKNFDITECEVIEYEITHKNLSLILRLMGDWLSCQSGAHTGEAVTDCISRPIHNCIIRGADTFSLTVPLFKKYSIILGLVLVLSVRWGHIVGVIQFLPVYV